MINVKYLFDFALQQLSATSCTNIMINIKRRQSLEASWKSKLLYLCGSNIVELYLVWVNCIEYEITSSFLLNIKYWIILQGQNTDTFSSLPQNITYLHRTHRFMTRVCFALTCLHCVRCTSKIWQYKIHTTR